MVAEVPAAELAQAEAALAAILPLLHEVGIA